MYFGKSSLPILHPTTSPVTNVLHKEIFVFADGRGRAVFDALGVCAELQHKVNFL